MEYLCRVLEGRGELYINLLYYFEWKFLFFTILFIKELGANLAGQDRLDNVEEETEEMSTSGVSTVNSAKVKMKPKNYEKIYATDEIAELKLENVRLVQDLLESHKMYQMLLKSTIEEQHLNLDMLRSFTTQISTVQHIYQRSVSQG